MTNSLLRRIKKVEALRRTAGRQGLLNEAYKILGNPVVMFDTDYKLMGHSEALCMDDPVVASILEKGGFDEQMQEFFKTEGFIDAVANSETISLLVSDKLKYDRMSGKVFNKANVHVANIVVVAGERKFASDDPVIFEAVCGAFSDVICSDEFFTEYAKSYADILIRKLVDGELADRELYSAHVAILYDGLDDNLFLALIDEKKDTALNRDAAILRELLASAQPGAKYAVYGGYVLVILSYEDEHADIKKNLAKLERWLKQKNAYCGISGRFENLFELPRYYNEAVISLKRGLISNTKEHIFLHEGAKN